MSRRSIALLLAVAAAIAGCQGMQTEVTVVPFKAPAAKSCEPPRPQYRCARAAKTIMVDGDLAEWTDVPAIALDQPSQARSDGGKWNGPADCSGTARMCFDGDYLYLAFDVTDDMHSQRYPEIPSWAGDCVQFAFDPLEDRTPRQYAADDHEFTISLTKDGPRIARWSTLRKGDVKDAKLAFIRKEGSGGVRYELAIPWDELTPLAPGLRSAFGFCFTFNDSDGKDMKAWLEWTDGICSGKNPDAFGQVLLDNSPPAAGKSDLFLAGDIERKPDVEALTFRLCRAVAEAQTVKADMTLLDADNRTVASAVASVPVEKGINLREIRWSFPRLADGTYHGTITVTPPEGAPATRPFDYERLITAPYRKRIQAIERAKISPELYGKYGPDVAYRRQVAGHWMDSSTDVERWRNVPALVDETERIVGALVKGKDPFASRRGIICRAYMAPEDYSMQPYRVEVPADYDGSRPYPLVVLLHGYGGNTLTFDLWWHLANKGTADPPRPGHITVIPYGRGNAGWRLLAANDIFHTIDAMKRDYNIDPDRVCVQGFSMGGSGTWSIATEHPDCWSACGPQAGGVGLGAWQRYKDGEPAADDLRARMSVASSAMLKLENLLNLPTCVYHGIDDQTVGFANSDAAFARLRELRYEAVLMAAVRDGHSMPGALRAGLVDWMLGFKRNNAPEKVIYRTADYGATKAYWVEIDELAEQYRLSEVRADWSKPGRIDVQTKNVRRLTLTLVRERLEGASTLALSINGTEAPVAGELTPGRQIHLLIAEDGKGWSAVDERYRPGLIKRAGMSGPMSDVFTGRFLFVVGTAGDQAATKANRDAADALAERMTGVTWGRFHANYRIVTDRDLTDAGAASSHLVLFGGPDTNTYARRIADGLPVKIEGGSIVFRGRKLEGTDAALRFIYPNPAHRDRYVIVQCGNLAKLADPLLSGSDWITVEGDKSESGVFDRDWK